MAEPPITPPPELVQQWIKPSGYKVIPGWLHELLQTATQWGADQELEACCEWLDDECRLESYHTLPAELRAARRPKPPSLAKEALIGLEMIDECAIDQMRNYVGFDELLTHKDTIRRALERLQQLEEQQ